MIQQQVCLVDFLSVTLSLSDLVFCAFTDVTGSLSQSDLVFCAFTDVAGSLSQSDLVFCAFTDFTCGLKVTYFLYWQLPPVETNI